MSVKHLLSDIKRGIIMAENMMVEQKTGELITYDVASKVKAILDEGTAENTRKAYRSDIEYIATWARIAAGYEMGYPVPPALLIRFITDHLGGMDEETDKSLVSMGIKSRMGAHSLNTICRRIASLSAAHEALKVENPCRSKEVSILLSKARRGAVKKGLGPGWNMSVATMRRLLWEVSVSRMFRRKLR